MKTYIPIAFAASLIAAAAPVAAQQARPERPYQGLFASGTDGFKHVLTVNGSSGAGVDTNILEAGREAGLIGPVVPTGSNRGSYGIFSAGLSYSMNLEGVNFGASVGTNA